MISKKNVMLQIPVRKEVAKTWQDIVKVSGEKQGDLFTKVFATFLSLCTKEYQQRKEVKKDGNSKVKKVD